MLGGSKDIMSCYNSTVVSSPEILTHYQSRRETQQTWATQRERRRLQKGTERGQLQPLIGSATHSATGVVDNSRLISEINQHNSSLHGENNIYTNDVYGASETYPRQHKHIIKNLSQGLCHLLERGELPPNVDLEHFLTVDGPMRARKAPIHHIKDKHDRIASTRVMTEMSGFSKMTEFKLDYDEMAKLPSKLSLNELKEWEMEAVQEEAAARALIRAQQAEMKRLKEMDAATQPDEKDKVVRFATPSLPHRDDPRSYTELLDLYSMHEFIIRKGRALRNTPEFASFKRHYKSSWGVIESCIEVFESFLRSYGVEVAYVDGKKLAVLASSALVHGEAMLSELDMLGCIANADEIYPLLGNMAHIYRYGSQGAHKAANKIQATWRMFKARIAYQHLFVGTRAAQIIQHAWGLHQSHKATRHALQTLRETKLSRWRQTNERFAQEWQERVRHKRRLLIHVPSLSVPAFHVHEIPFYVAQQMAEVMRLSDLADPLVKMILVLPFKPESEVLEYYYTLLADMGMTHVNSRLTILTPEEAIRLPSEMSLTRLTVLSSRLMKMLAALSVGTPSYIIPGIIGPDELTMCAELNLPLLGPEPRVAQVFGTKSGTKRLLEAAAVTTPLGATLLRTREDCLRALASLMVEHRDITRWLIKLETESGSRGHAYFDVSRMHSLRGVEHAAHPTHTKNVKMNTNENENERDCKGGETKQREESVGTVTSQATLASSTTITTTTTTTTTTTMQNGEQSKSAMLFDLVLQELNEYGGKRVRIIHTGSYPTWSSYLDMLDNVGAVIEAVPSNIIANLAAHVYIEPDGTVHLESIVEQMLSPSFTVMSSCYPVTQSVPYRAIRDAALSVGKAAFRKRIIGYLSVDFVLFSKRIGKKLEFAKVNDALHMYNEMLNNVTNNNSNAEDVTIINNNKAVSTTCKKVYRLWGVDVDLHRTNYASAHAFAMNLMQCTWDEENGVCVTSNSNDENNTRNNDNENNVEVVPHTRRECKEKMYYVYSGLIYNPFIASIRHSTFFSVCSHHGIAFDRVKRKGMIFQMPDVLLRSCIGAISVSDNRAESVKWMSEFQRLLYRELPRQGEHSAESNFVYFSSAIRQLGRVVHSLPSNTNDVNNLQHNE